MDDMKTPHPVDLVVGTRVRRARLARGMSQGTLAENIGFTFQQVQKYENGSNRISASKLVEIADNLGVPPESFLEGLGQMSPGRRGAKPVSKEADDLMALYAQLPPSIRDSVLKIVRSLVEGLDRPAKRASQRSPAGTRKARA